MVRVPAHQMRTYQMDQPLDTHFRAATCVEVDCANHATGWKMGFDLTDDEKARAARWIRDKSGRAYTYELFGGSGLPEYRVVFTFPAGQRCFRTHRVPLERDPFLVVRGGDFRGNPERQVRRHRSAEGFLDQWSNDLDKLNTVRERG